MDTQADVARCACCEEALTGAFIRLWAETDLRVCYDCLDWMNGQRQLQVEPAGSTVHPVGHEPIFRVLDVTRALEHYRALGFRTELHDETYAFASLGDLTLHLALESGEGWPGYRPDSHMTSALYLHVEDADKLAEQWRRAGMTVHGPRNEDYGKREGQHVDPDGNLLRFGSPVRG